MADVATRYNAIKDEINTLSFQFKKNNVPFNAYQLTEVKIYNTHEDALADVNPIQTIPGASVANPSTGLYQYAVNAISSPGTYYDVVYIIPETGLGVAKYINSFYIQEYSSELPVVEGKCTIYGFIRNSDGSPVKGATVTIKPVKFGIITTGNILVTERIAKTRTNDAGAWSLSVFASAISGTDYRISFLARDLDISQTITVPSLDSIPWETLISSVC